MPRAQVPSVIISFFKTTKTYIRLLYELSAIVITCIIHPNEKKNIKSPRGKENINHLGKPIIKFLLFWGFVNLFKKLYFFF